MPTITQVVGTKTSLACSALPTLGSGAYCASDTYVANTNKPLDVAVELEAATTNTPAGNKQVVLFIKESLDGTNFRSGPESGTTTTDERNLRWLGQMDMNSASVTQRATFSVANALGYVPHSFKIIAKNDLGVALTSGALSTSEISAVSA